MRKRLVLVINTYGGSLLVAARSAGHKVTAVLEDVGYGQEVVRANFPKVPYYATTAEWPKQDLAGTIVLAHPPCAAFSVINTANKAHTRGLDAVKFQQTKAVLVYALKSGCDALAVESVCGACEGAAEVHASAARKFGYNLYRVLQDASFMGVPQRRQRFWALFIRRDLPGSPNWLRVSFKPQLVAINDVVGYSDPAVGLMQAFDEQRGRLTKRYGRARALRLLRGEEGFGWLTNLVGRLEHNRLTPAQLKATSKQLVVHGSFRTASLYILNPAETSPTLLHHSFWALDGQPLGSRGYNLLMGFPQDYIFPNPKRQREFLSRGVCPPVASFVLKTLQANFDGTARGDAYTPGSTIDLRAKRAEWRLLRDGR